MKWFKHISTSLDDPFIHDLIDQFGPTGYLVFFGTLEIYAREFKPEVCWKLDISLRYLCSKLVLTRRSVVIKVLEYIHSCNKWEVTFVGDRVYVKAHKFRALVDEYTQKLIKENREELSILSGENPESVGPIEEEEEEEEEEYIRVPPNPPLKGRAVPYQKIVSLYNEICVSMPRVRKLDERKRDIAARWKANPSLETFEDVFRRAEASDFLAGRTDRWQGANFDWLMKPKNFIKVLEGNYSNRSGTSRRQPHGDIPRGFQSLINIERSSEE